MRYKLLLSLSILLVLILSIRHFQQELSQYEITPPTAEAVVTEPTEVTVEPPPPETEPAPVPTLTTAKLVAVGDILVHSSVYQDAAMPDGTFDFTPMFEQVKPFIESADLAIANQETMIGGKEIGLSSYPLFNSPFEVADALKDTGFDLVTLANNHTIDRYKDGAIERALAYWDQIEIPYTGSYASTEDRDHIRTLTRNSIVFSFLSYTYGTNGIPIPKDKPYYVNLIDWKQIQLDVERARQISDVIVVSMHWGNEYELHPNTLQQDLAQRLSDLGVHIIIGHHPHVLQPPAWVTNAKGHSTYVMYSLGNFISAQQGIDRLLGGIGGIHVVKTELEGNVSIELKDPFFIPTLTQYKNWKNFKLIPLDWDHEHTLRVANHMRTRITDLSILHAH
ncbi:CapA family protein [Ammoniphilus sp. YIM 78166]|uniref:CapA family protein n=1 Tax=Ammoniphilus sp. YIM 78166 TaxID=1644106 RepID=UPI00106F6FA1|nr:CapA family protein [Ammoniphilus sp. YIM 78166]